MTATAVPTQGFNVPPVPGAPVTTQPAAPAAPAAPPAAPPAAVVPPIAPAAPAAPAQPFNPTSAQPGAPAPRAYTQAELLAIQLGGGQVPAAQAAPAAPAAPVVPQAPVAPAAPAAQAPAGVLNTLDVSTIENAELRNLGELLTLSAPGLDIDRAIGTAIAEGNPAYIDKAYLTEKFGANAPKLVALAEKIVGVAAAEAQSIITNIHSLAGGEANWKAAMAAFNQNAPDYLKYAAKQLLDSTASSKINQGAKLVTDFAVQGGFVAQAGGTSVVPQGGRAGEQGIDKLTFQTELRKLDKNAADFVEQRNMLFYRRQMGKNRGM